MQLSEQVCSLDLSKQLDELGITKASYLYWALVGDIWIIERPCEIDMYKQEFYNAYTVAELGEILKNIWFSTCFVPGESLWRGDFFDCEERTKEYKPAIWGETEAHCRAKALIYCIENGLIKVEDINNVAI